MSEWTKLAYGTIAATVLVSGGVAYQSIVQAQKVANLIEAVNERSAAVAPWPWTTNAAYTGWGTGYRTNIEDSSLWSFMGYRIESSYPWTRYIPLVAGDLPARAINESLRQVKVILPSFVSGLTTNSISAPIAQYLSVTGVWASLRIGDGTSKWTVAYRTNGLPVYSDTVSSSICTTTFAEVWQVLNVMTQSMRLTTPVSQTNEAIRNPFGGPLGHDGYGCEWNLDPSAPDGNPNGDANAIALNHYEIGGTWTTNAFTSSDQPFERWISLPMGYTYLEQVTWDSGAVTRTNTMYVSSDPSKSRLSGDRSVWTYKVDFPSFPSGLVAEVSFVYRVAVSWSVKAVGMDTNISFSATSTAAVQSVSFTGSLATNMTTNAACLVETPATNWIPDGLRIADNTFIFDEYQASTGGWYTVQAWRWKASEIQSSPYFNFGGQILADPPIALITWDWIYKREDQ